MSFKKIITFFLIFSIVFAGIIIFDNPVSAETLSVTTSADWSAAQATSDNVVTSGDALHLSLVSKRMGNWTSEWYYVSDVTDPTLEINVSTTLFDRMVRTILYDGSTTPIGSYEWYGRPCIYIDETNYSRWIMGFRVGMDHSEAADGSAMIFSTDEGKTWGDYCEYYNGTSIRGFPVFPATYDGEPYIFFCPNGDLLCHLWNGLNSGDFLQYRSTDNGFTWTSEGAKSVSGIGAGNYVKLSQQYVMIPGDPYTVYAAAERRAHPFYSYLVKTTDNGTTWSLVSTIDATDTFEPSLEYVGDNTLLSVLRPGDAASGGYGQTLQRYSTNNGATWGSLQQTGYWHPYPTDGYSGDIHYGTTRVWERARTYMESNPWFDANTYMNYSNGEGRMWGIGTQDYGGAQESGSPYTNRTIAIYWSDEKGADGTWNYVVLYAEPSESHADPPSYSTVRCAGYSDMRRRSDGSFCAASYYDPSGEGPADLVQIDFGGERARVMVECDTNDDGIADENTSWQEIYNETNYINLSSLSTINSQWRILFHLSNNDTEDTPYIEDFHGEGFSISYTPALTIEIEEINNQENNTVTQDVITNFNWTKVTGASVYQLRIANDSDFIDVYLNLTDINEANYGINYTETGSFINFTLPEAYRKSWYQYYYFQVRAYYTN